MTALDFAPLLVPGLPPPAVKFNGFPKYNFTGGHNDGEQIPLEAIVKAANDVLTREGRTLSVTQRMSKRISDPPEPPLRPSFIDMLKGVFHKK